MAGIVVQGEKTIHEQTRRKPYTNCHEPASPFVFVREAFVRGSPFVAVLATLPPRSSAALLVK
jgi:hypothetical protein